MNSDSKRGALLTLSYWALDLESCGDVDSVNIEIGDFEPPILRIEAQVQPTRIITDILSDDRWDNRLVECYTNDGDCGCVHVAVSLDPIFDNILQKYVLCPDGLTPKQTASD